LSSLENQPASNIQERQAGISTGILGVLQEKIKVLMQYAMRAMETVLSELMHTSSR
jgi:F0F1-type ATP synthase epsilon subunit